MTWAGDLRHLTTRAWADETTEAVAVAMSGDGEATIWLNLCHCRGTVTVLVWAWARHAAQYRPPLDVLYAEDLAQLALLWQPAEDQDA